MIIIKNIMLGIWAIGGIAVLIGLFYIYFEEKGNKK